MAFISTSIVYHYLKHFQVEYLYVEAHYPVETTLIAAKKHGSLLGYQLS
jgi:hypothetical protein